jgi:hypothetical protein
VIRQPLVLVAALWGSAADAGFDAPTVCTGMLNFFNSDGSFETYALRLEFAGDSYLIRAMNFRSREVTEDTGRCDLYLDGGCRHVFPPAGDFEGDHYVFGLETRDDGRYLYVETWADGFSGQTVVDCRPAGSGG